MKSMAELTYYFGLKMRIYPSTKQKQIIQINSDISRTIYNKLVAIDQELYNLEQVKLPIDTIQVRIGELKCRKSMKNMSNHYQYMQDERIDSLTKANAFKNYQKAWNMYRKVHKAGMPKYHKKCYRQSYQTNCQYGKNKPMDMFSGTVRFTDKKHIRIPKLGKLRVSGSYRHILDND